MDSFLGVLRLGGEELRAGGPYTNLALLSAPIGEATVWDKQGRTTSYGDDAPFPSSFRHSCIQLEPPSRSNLPDYEVSVARSPAIQIQTNVP